MLRASRGLWGRDSETALADVGMPLIEIPDDLGLCLVVELPVGCSYYNQTGGYSCRQAWAEGLLVPLPPHDGVTEQALDQIFGPDGKYRGCCSERIDGDDADRIDALLAKHHPAFCGEQIIRVDRERLADSWEAWVHVRIGRHPARPPRLPLALGGPAPLGTAENAFFWPFYGLPSDEAILTWPNSD